MHLKEKIDHEMYEELLENFIILHRNQFMALGLPEIYWRDLCMKLKDEIFDAGNFFQIRQRVNEDDEILGYKAVCTSNLSKNNPAGVFLVDHAWTYKVNDARSNLRNSENLLERMCNMMHIGSDEDKETKIETVFESMWKYNQTYKISTEKLTDEEREPIWYIMDEFGSSIRHSDTPNVRCVPFLFLPSNLMFSIIWPVEDLQTGEEITRDYAFGIEDETIRRCKLLPWIEDIDDEDYELTEKDATIQEEPGIEYFKSNRHEVSLPDKSNLKTQTGFSQDKKLSVFTDYELVKQLLTDGRFSFVEEIEKADIRWTEKSCNDYKTLNEKFPDVLVNHFAFEEVLTCKDMLAVVSRRVEGHKNWLPITYNLNYELADFIAYWKKREDEESDNLWILKPWNLTRSLDMVITSNLNQIIRYQETGPKIACKYIENPVLYYRDDISSSVKFDLRYHIMLKSVVPLKLSCSKVFTIRLGNRQFSLEDFDEFEKHFTVMKYKNFDAKFVHYLNFMQEFEKQNTDFKWADIEVDFKIFDLLNFVQLKGASKEEPPKGLAHNPQSRALYGVDVLLEWRSNENGLKTIEPMICEVTYMPDCMRPCETRPEFYNDVFNALFIENSRQEYVFEI